MKYCNYYFLRKQFNDGTFDKSFHPYVVLLDTSYTNDNKIVMLKAKTYDPLKHQKYVNRGQSQIMTLKKLSVINCDQAYLHDDEIKSDNQCDFKEFYKVAETYNQYQITHSYCDIYKVYGDILKNHLINNFT